MKKIIFVFLCFFFITYEVNSLSLPKELNEIVTADSLILINMDKNEVIYEKNPDKKEILASLTKIMTAYTVIENIDNLNKVVTITDEDIANLYGFTCAGLKPGDKLSYLDLLYATILLSAADASQALALHTGGTIENFNEMMNKEARNLGLRQSNFADSYGGDDNNISTAREMSRLLSRALENETFKKVFTTTTKTLSNGIQVTNYSRSIATFHGLDSDILKGNKSGYTPEAGLLLASIAKIENTNYMLIIMKSEVNEYMSTHILDTYRVYNYLYNVDFKERTLLEAGTILKRISVENATISEYLAIADKSITATLTDEDYKKVKLEYNITDKLTTDNKTGDIIGYVDILVDNELIETYNVYLKDDITSPEKQSKLMILLIVTLLFLALILLFTNLLGFYKKKNTKIKITKK